MYIMIFRFCFTVAMIISPVQKKVALPHGMAFGQKVDNLQGMRADKLEAFMGKMIRISTTITGMVIQVDTPKGGWFRMDAGNGKVIAVHFRDYGMILPKELKGRTVMVQGVAQKLLNGKVDPKRKLTFEASGLMVE